LTPEEDVQAALYAEFGRSLEYHCPEFVRALAKTPMIEVLAGLNGQAESGRTIAALVPSATETRWFQNYCFPWEVRFLRGRVRFRGRGEGSPPFPCTVVVMGPPVRRGRVFFWDLRRYPQMPLFAHRLAP
jgi:hypothetical protein